MEPEVKSIPSLAKRNDHETKDRRRAPHSGNCFYKLGIRTKITINSKRKDKQRQQPFARDCRIYNNRIWIAVRDLQPLQKEAYAEQQLKLVS
jgi:hypothetical protein